MLIEEREMRRRLLQLFPKATLDSFPAAINKQNKIEMVEAVVDSATIDDINRFVRDRFGRLHQHTHIFEPDDRIAEALDEVVPLGATLLESPVTVRGEHHSTYILPLDYHLILGSPLEEHIIRFPWPFKVVTATDHCRIHFTIMAKDIRAHMADDRPIEKVTQQPTRRELLRAFPSTLSLDPVTPLDFNKGVKDLWKNNDIFDARNVKHKRVRATSRDVMDGSYTIKRDDPVLFQELMGRPLFDTAFVLWPEHQFTKYFIANPTKGILSFRCYSEKSEDVDEFIRRILEVN